MSIIFGPDPVADAVRYALERLENGQPVTEGLHVDLKEEAGLHRADGNLSTSSETNERAAQQLAAEAACMANTPGGGALIVGVADDSTVLGTQLGAEWVRRRIYELTDRRLTVEVNAVTIRSRRLLVIRSPEALEPVRYRKKITWRVEDRCVEVDAGSWHERMRNVLGFDWSAQPTGRDLSEVSPSALEVARRFLNASGEPHARELAAVGDQDLLRRIGAVNGEGRLTRAAVILFVPTDLPSIDYLRREHHGGDSTERVAPTGVAVLEALQEIFGHSPRTIRFSTWESTPSHAGRFA